MDDIRLSNASGGGLFGSGIYTPLEVYEDLDGQLVILEGKRRYLCVETLEALNDGYVAPGLPCIMVSRPTSLWDQTRATFSRHNRSEISIIDQVKRAVELKSIPNERGKPATWNDVCKVMGESSSHWSNMQNLLQLIPELQAAVLLPADAVGSVRAELGALIGSKLTQDLQRKHLKDLTDPRCKQRKVLERLIERILASEAMRSQIDDDDQIVVFGPEAPDVYVNGTNGSDPGLDLSYTPPPPDDDESQVALAEAEYMVKMVYQALINMENASPAVWQRFATDFGQFADRFSYLQSLAKKEEAVYA